MRQPFLFRDMTRTTESGPDGEHPALLYRIYLILTKSKFGQLYFLREQLAKFLFVKGCKQGRICPDSSPGGRSGQITACGRFCRR